MRLAAFIRSNVELIATEWELFARTLLPEAEFSKSVLRDGIADILAEIANDMDSSQSDAQQQEKSEGEPRRDPHTDNSAERHALARVKMGLSARQVISEFRALRATVIRLWHSNTTERDELSVYDITRFNEAVDQALTEAAVRYTSEVEKSRELFLGILGHDLRNPRRRRRPMIIPPASASGFISPRKSSPRMAGRLRSNLLIQTARFSPRACLDSPPQPYRKAANAASAGRANACSGDPKPSPVLPPRETLQRRRLR